MPSSRSDLPLPPTDRIDTVMGSVAHFASTTPDKEAVIVGGESLTYRQLAEAVNYVAGGLARRSRQAGIRVAVETSHAIEHLIGALGAMAAGAIAVPLPAEKAAYLEILDNCQPALILGTGREPADADAALHRPRIAVAALLAEAQASVASPLERAVEGAEIAMLYYTSGTSLGVRKGVMQSYRQLHNTAHYVSQVMRMDGSVREFVATPVDNAFWFGRCRCVLHVGGTLLLSSGTLNPLGIIAAVNKHDGNAIAGDTPVFMLLLQHMERHLARLAPAIRWIKVASAPMPAENKKRLMEVLPNAWIVNNYGLTEAMRTCLHPMRETPHKLATVGQPSPSVSIKIVDANDEELPAFATSEVCISGGNLASGYWQNEAMWARKFRDGWYHTDDLGFIDDDGFLTLKGRADHAINSGGKTIALSEVEERLHPLFLNTTFAVCGMNDPKGILGEIVVLCIEGEWKEAVPWKDFRIRAFEVLSQIMVPREAFVVSRFPRTSNGKLQLGKMRERIEAGEFPRL